MPRQLLSASVSTPRSRATSGWWRRRRVIRRLAAIAACAVLTALVVNVRDAAELRAGWGTRVEVVVARHALARGHTLSTDDLAVRELPLAAVPDGAVAGGALDELHTRTLRLDLAAGEVLLVDRVAPVGVDGPAALIPPGSRAVSVPLWEGPPGAVMNGFSAGARVDLIALDDPFGEAWGGAIGGASGPTVLAADAEIIAVGDNGALVVVEENSAPQVAAASARGALVVVLRGS